MALKIPMLSCIWTNASVSKPHLIITGFSKVALMSDVVLHLEVYCTFVHVTLYGPKLQTYRLAMKHSVPLSALEGTNALSYTQHLEALPF